MTNKTTRNKPSQPKQQQGGHGGGSQHQQQNPQPPRQPGSNPDVHEKMPDPGIDRESGDQRRNIDVERE